MLQRISLENFKLFKTATVNLGRITVLIGKQGAGKSTILNVLKSLKNWAGKEVTASSEFGFESMVHKKLTQETVSIGLSLRFEDGLPPFAEGDSFEAEYYLQLDNGGFREQSCVYKFQSQRLEFRTPRTGRWSIPDTITMPGKPQISFRGGSWVLLPFVFNLSDRDYTVHRGMMLWQQRMIDYFVSDCFIVPDNRPLVMSRYPDLGGPFATPEVPQLVEAVISSLAHREDLRLVWSSWLDRVVGREVVLRRVAGEILIETGGLVLPIESEGAGARQLMLPLGILALAEPGSLIVIDEPEVHLHPDAQLRLCEILVEAATTEGKQLVITTQSEHIVLGLLNFVTSKNLQPEELRVYFLSEKNYVGTAEELPVTEDGALQGGLKGFAETSLAEFGDYLAARRKL